MEQREVELIDHYTQRGYQHVHLRRDEPHFRYHMHYHPHHLTLHVVEGQLEVEIDKQKVLVKAGDRIEIDAERFHTVCMGPQGCVYLHAERH